MLTRLHIENIALVDHAVLIFNKGMTALTGETGAGKSVIVNAISLILGGRADKELIRHDSDMILIEASFDVSRLPARYKQEFDSCLSENMLYLRREVYRDGHSRVKIANTNATLTRLREITAPLAEILGQHAGQMLMNEDQHLIFLDSFASLTDSREETVELYHTWQSAASDLEKVMQEQDSLQKERELLLFQQEEIEKANIRVGERDELMHERKILDSSRALMHSSAIIRELIDGEENSVLTMLRSARKELDKMAAIDNQLADRIKNLTDLDYQLEDFRAFIEQYGSSILDDPARIEEINHRLDEIYAITRKHGGSESDVLITLDTINQQLKDRPETDKLIASLKESSRIAKEAYTNKALDLASVRTKAAGYLQTLVIKELSELAINNGGFSCKLIREEEAGGIDLDGLSVKAHPFGLEQACFLFSANQGEPLKSLVKTASGGEISRVLLALKSAEKKNNQRTNALMVFDEVDAGIGGTTAIEIGKKLKRLSEDGQVIVITHLHQIARLADHHMMAQKATGADGRTVIAVLKLEAADINRELDRMVALPEEV